MKRGPQLVSAAIQKTIIELRGVRKVFGSQSTEVAALRGIDLDVHQGEFVACMGASGSGKSTLLHMIAGLDPPTEGTIRVGDTKLEGISDDELTMLRRKKIGFIFQAFNLLEVLTAEENVAIPLLIDGVPEAEANRRAREVLDLVGMSRRATHAPAELSGGEQQRVAIARALVTQPLLLLADEPSGNLDSANGDQVMKLLRSLVDEHDQTIFMVTHSPRHAALADRLITLRDGRIIEDEPLPESHDARELARDLDNL